MLTEAALAEGRSRNDKASSSVINLTNGFARITETLRQDVANSTERHQKEMADLRAEHVKAVAALKAKYEHASKNIEGWVHPPKEAGSVEPQAPVGNGLKAWFSASPRKLATGGNHERDTLSTSQADHSEQIRKLELTFAGTLEENTTLHSEVIGSLRRTIEERELELQAVISEMYDSHAKALRQNQLENAEELEALKAGVREFNNQIGANPLILLSGKNEQAQKGKSPVFLRSPKPSNPEKKPKTPPK
eukprot:FR741305.1.p1 GENE.FR741305.1~~FR741305.1.p1  ORF type:complete len:249 (+),score=44.37 FR741305.1:326-1072(+)